jgi:hypothetical protein
MSLPLTRMHRVRYLCPSQARGYLTNSDITHSKVGTTSTWLINWGCILHEEVYLGRMTQHIKNMVRY